MPNLLNLGVSAIVANSVTQGAFNSNIIDFFTGRMDGVYKAGGDGSFRLTLPELLGFAGGQGFGGTYGKGLGFQKVVMDNLKNNAVPMIGTIIFAPMVANVLKKSLAKPVIRPMNRLLKDTGLNVKVA
tara:strand:- start:313 stop:696 length:384 start_codon:yes stop_codon:yes gene_type:complete